LSFFVVITDFFDSCNAAVVKTINHCDGDGTTVSDTPATSPTTLTTPHAAPPADASVPTAATAASGDLLVRGFFSPSQDAIFDIRIQDLNAQTCVNKDPQKCLIASENEKKKKYQKKCEEHCRAFVPFVVSVDHMFGPEAVNTPKRIAQLLSEGYVKSRMSITTVCAKNLCLRGPHMKSCSLSNRRCRWDEACLCHIVFTTNMSDSEFPFVCLSFVQITLARQSQETKLNLKEVLVTVKWWLEF